MSRRMSCSMTIPAVLDRSKTVTRRHVDTWKTLKPGDRLTLIEKGMGLAKGAKQVVLAEVEVVDVRVEELWVIGIEPAACFREGLPGLSADEFMAMWLDSHGYGPAVLSCGALALEKIFTPCRRIEWRYLEPADSCTTGASS